jgi:predicted ATP-grasp superfamily ATP-dependent carboligase
MNLDLKEEPKNPTIIEGFPGFGFVSTIATEFLIKHLKAKKIGKINRLKNKP